MGQSMVNAQLSHGRVHIDSQSPDENSPWSNDVLRTSSTRKGEHVSRLALCRRRCLLGVQDAVSVFQIHAPWLFAAGGHWPSLYAVGAAARHAAAVACCATRRRGRLAQRGIHVEIEEEGACL